MAAAVRSDLEQLFSPHPAADTLTAVAEFLAGQLDHPLTALDGRIAATVSRELRMVIGVLVGAPATETDDLFAGLAGPVIVPGGAS